MKFYEVILATTTYHAVSVWGDNEHEAVDNALANTNILDRYGNADCPLDVTKAISVKPLDNDPLAL